MYGAIQDEAKVEWVGWALGLGALVFVVVTMRKAVKRSEKRRKRRKRK